MGRGDFIYDVVVLLHILGAIVGFGTVFLNGLYGAQAKRRGGAGGVAIGEANLAVSGIAEYVIYTVPVTGIILVLTNDGWDFGQTWVWLAIVLYAVGLGIAHGNQMPSARKMTELAAQLQAQVVPAAAASSHGDPLEHEIAPAGPPPQVAEMARLEKRLAAGGGALNLLLVVLLVLMIWKPGI